MAATETPQAAAAKSRQGLASRFTVLKGAPHELWVTFAVKLLGIVAYSVMNSTLVLWLSYDLGFSDVLASSYVFGWSAAMTLFTVLVGSFTDAIGLRRTFLLGLYVCILARAVLTFATSKWLALAAGLLPLAIGEALGTPVLVAAVRRYSSTAQRSISFAIFYAVMNVGFLIASYLFDFVRQGLGEPHGRLALPFFGIELTTYRTLFLLSLAFELTLLPIIYFGVREGVEATDEGVRILKAKVRDATRGFWDSLLESCKTALRDTLRIFGGLWRQPGFYKFLMFLGLAAFVRLIFMHMYYTYPKFGIRELGAGAPIGRLFAINSVLIIVLVPLVGAWSQRVAAYRMVTVGSVIAAASVYIMALPTAWFEPLAQGVMGEVVGHWYLRLHGPVHAYYVMIFLFIVLLSIGESVYSPRLYEYAACIAPKGQEASYMSVSYLPFFLAKLLVASSSGFLLERYCPQNGPRASGKLWLMIALTTTVCPLGLVLLRRFIRVREEGREG